jgi:hypothetical protein
MLKLRMSATTTPLLKQGVQAQVRRPSEFPVDFPKVIIIAIVCAATAIDGSTSLSRGYDAMPTDRQTKR